MAREKDTDSGSNEKLKIITPEFRASYPHLLKPNSFKGQEPKYSVTMLFPKTGDLSVIKEAIRHAKIDAWGADKSNWPEDFVSPVDDGDGKKYADKDGYQGCWVIKASTKAEYHQPEVVDIQGEPILQAKDFYAGCYARASVFANHWEYMGKEGIHFLLDHVQKTRDGKPFSSRKSASQTFGPLGSAEMEDDDSDDFR